MQFRVFASVSCLLGLALINTVSAAVDPVSLAVIVIAGLAIAKEKLIAAEIHRNYIRRPAPVVESYGEPSGYGHKRVGRQAEEVDAFEPILRSALELDTDDCAKVMVCHTFEKEEAKLNVYEAKIKKLFSNANEKVDANSATAQYQLAAFVGSLRQPGLCHTRYPRCLANPEALSNISL